VSLKVLECVIKSLVERGKLGRAKLYKRLLSSLMELMGNKQLCFADMDVPFLNRYEAFLYKEGLVENSINTYLKVLRALLNKATQAKLTLARTIEITSLQEIKKRIHKLDSSHSAENYLAYLNAYLSQAIT
jgi:hypothetical protein